MNEYSLLALLAQLLHQTSKSSVENIQLIRESVISKEFIRGVCNYEVEGVEDGRRRAEVSKILSLLMLFIVKRGKELVEFRMIG